MPNVLVDSHQRHIKKLRLSLLDACNMRCLYCMPDAPQFMPKEHWLSAEEIYTICKNLTTFGIKEIRLTGGEATLRPDFLNIVAKLSTLNLSKLALTTNGARLQTLLPELRSTKLSHINISLDSLNPKTFQSITKTNELETILKNIEVAMALGFKIKINTVLLRGINDHEVDDFVDFSRRYKIPVRFLEVMKIGVMVSSFDRHFISADDIITKMSPRYQMHKKVDALDSTALNYELDNGANIGFIASETKSFCGQCSRLRMGPEGTLYPCLFVDHGINIKKVKLEDYPELLKKLISKKPKERLPEVLKPMYAIGG